ncbi:unnamed protein product [Didymodactylos carnosus]|uniref:5'-3' exoribonuclease n=1 Tax=Didymodactylos carnosus TaxID=1234261 RepID=A0A813QWK0_9BILA|nr:unnamed protein product [Didymodactylos carnosus]CAF0794598.1 unnamed protein product [Didymodactylos carnosus]CAF3554830.1 unnamed protein product [Didymodactylos carnosus]CAF3577485.1 unnamed protein product [Didymodactylos carnosus]
MGVPAFFRWLTRKYPSIINNCIEDKPSTDNQGVYHPMDTSGPNPNGIEFDNLYLDMNGIIHPCTHPEDRAPPKNEDEMMLIIFECIDRIFSIVRPRKLLYMAIDGVAPRAKMNQQRSRRFRASKETVDKNERMEKIKAEIRAKGGLLPEDNVTKGNGEEKQEEERFDSNCITPGTPFMFRLADCLRYYIHLRMNNDPGWKNIKVILSDANVPGEGEHKIMDYIRRQRAQPDHNPNTHHVLCGADADLIMLGLATHEPYFTIIREEFKPNKPRPCDICGQIGHEMKDCKGLPKEKFGKNDELNLNFHSETQFIFLRLSILREYLYRDLRMNCQLSFTWDIERAIDDWVFMCFFVGNDFLPHLPSLEIRENAIDRLIRLYKENIPKFNDYLTENGIPNMERVQIILNGIGKVEDEIFHNRHEQDKQQRRREKERSQPQNKRHRAMTDPSTTIEMPVWMQCRVLEPQPITQRPTTNSITNPAQANAQLRQMQGMNSNTASESQTTSTSQRGAKRKYDEAEGQEANEQQDEEDEDANDSVRLWEDGWRDRYYKNKFNVNKNESDTFRAEVARHYARGLCWVLQYYYQGVPAWDWYFPYHYAPFASDFINLKDLSTKFDKQTKPFKPLEQLMAVFPSQSRQFLPEKWQILMYDKQSPIIDFYPTNFSVDLNGKRYEWQGVALLPFVDEKRLHRTLETVYMTLTPNENKRNTRGYDSMYIHRQSECFDYFNELYADKEQIVKRKNAIDIPTQQSNGISGKIWCDEYVVRTDEIMPSPLKQCENIKQNQVISVKYRDPQYSDDYLFKSQLLKNVTIPTPTLKPLNYDNNRPYRPNLGFAQQPQFQRDFQPAQRFINHSLGGHQQNSYQYNQRQQQGNMGNQYQQSSSYRHHHRSQSDNSSFGQYNEHGGHQQQQRQQQQSYWTDAPAGSSRPRFSHNNNNSYRPNNNGRGSWQNQRY